MLACGFDPDARDKDGVTPLHRAAMGGHLDAVRVLLPHGADVERARRHVRGAAAGVGRRRPQHTRASRRRPRRRRAAAHRGGLAARMDAAGRRAGPERTLEGLIDLRRAAAVGEPVVTAARWSNSSSQPEPR